MPTNKPLTFVLIGLLTLVVGTLLRFQPQVLFFIVSTLAVVFIILALLIAINLFAEGLVDIIKEKIERRRKRLAGAERLCEPLADRRPRGRSLPPSY